MSRFPRLVAAIAVAPAMLHAVSANAAMMNYGTFVGDTITFADVTEESLGDNLLYDDFDVLNDTLLFDSSGFGVLSPSPGSDLADSEIELMIVANTGYAITMINYAEEGDFTIVGDALVNVGLPYFWEIVEVDGVAIVPIVGSGQTSFASTFVGAGQLWGLSFELDVEQLLADAEAERGEIGTSITKINLRFDNSITATSNNASSVAFLKKKQILGLTVASTEFIPEPAAIYSLVLGLVALAIRRRVGQRS